MKFSFMLFVAILAIAVNGFAQTIPNATLQERIQKAGAENNIMLTYDPVGKATKLMAESENFEKSDANRAGVLAMNFAVGVIYPGDTLAKAPDTFQFAFWVLSRKPRFSANHAMTAVLPEEMLVIGSARYVSKPREQMEYLNFEISRENLTRIAAETSVRFYLGDHEFTFTRSQMKVLANVLLVTEVK